MGASPDSIDVFVEVDTRQRKLLATATGVPELRTGRPAVEALPAEELRRIRGFVEERQLLLKINLVKKELQSGV
jgi:hypothetical protein